MLAIVWTFFIILLSVELTILYLLYQRKNHRIIYCVLMLSLLLWWWGQEMEPLSRTMAVLFSPFFTPFLLLWAIDEQFWPAIITFAFISVVGFFTFPVLERNRILWFVIATIVAAEVPFLIQDSWSRPIAMAQAETLRLSKVSMPRFRTAVRFRLDGTVVLEKSNGVGYKNDDTYLWSYSDRKWFKYDPIWYTHTKFQ